MATDIALVIFDWAGTVIDFGCLAPAGAFQRAFAERNVPVTMAEVRAPMGLHKKDHLRVMLQAPPLAARWQTVLGRPWNEEDIDRLYQRVTPMQVAAAAEHADLIPGVHECVAELNAMNVRIAGTTGYFREAADVVAVAARKQGYVPEFNICADDVPAGRPKPWMIFRCMEALDVYPPRRVVKVGDTLVDIEDGRNAGVWSVAVVDSSSEMGLSLKEWIALAESDRERRRTVVRDRFLTAGADAVLNTLSEIPGYVQQLNSR